MNKAVSFLSRCFRAGGADGHKAAKTGSALCSSQQPSPLDPLQDDRHHRLGASPSFYSGIAEAQSCFNSLSPYTRQATPPCLPTNPVCLPLSRTFPVATATPLGRPALLCIPVIEQAISSSPLRQREMGFIPPWRELVPPGKELGSFIQTFNQHRVASKMHQGPSQALGEEKK